LIDDPELGLSSFNQPLTRNLSPTAKPVNTVVIAAQIAAISTADITLWNLCQTAYRQDLMHEG
jgi:hypothetical protein